MYTLCSVQFCSFLELLGVEAFLHSECVFGVVWFGLVSLSMAGPASAAIGFFLEWPRGLMAESICIDRSYYL